MAAGEAAAGGGDRMAAIDHFTLAASLGDNLRPRLARGLAFFGGGWYVGAAAEFDRILAGHADEPAALFWRGMAKWRAGRQQDALKDMDAAVSLDPLNPVFLANRGSLLTDLGWIDQATGDFKNAATFGEYDADVQGMRARFFAWRLKDLDLATAAYGRLVELTPKNSQLWLEYTMILLQEHDCRALIAAERMRAVCAPDDACQFTQSSRAYTDALEQLRLERSCPDPK